MKKILTILPLLFLLFHTSLKAQTDTEFWFAVPEGTSGHGTGEIVYVHLASLEADVEVTIDMPTNATFTPTTFTILAKKTQRLDLTWYVRSGYGAPPYNILTNVPNNGTANANNILESGLAATAGLVENKGIHIVSTGLITAYLERRVTLNPEIWALKGSNAIGTDFYVPSQAWRPNGGYTPTPYNAIDIVATEDTWVYFKAPVAIFNIGGANITYSRFLSRGQSICLRANAQTAAAHLGGTHVWSDGNIVVQWKDDSVSGDGGCFDMNGDQMIPTRLAGNEYIVMRGQLTNSREYAWLMPLQAGTIIDFAVVSGVAPTSIALGAPGTQTKIMLNNKNGTYNDPLPAPQTTIDALHIKSRNGEPFLVYHVAGFGCEMGAAILPTIKGCTGSTEVNFQRATNEGFFLNIMTKEPHINDFFITINNVDYNIPVGWFTEIPGTGASASTNWWYLDRANTNFGVARPGMPAVITNAVTTVRNTSGIFHLGLINGGTTSGCRYGYFSDFDDNYGQAVIASSGSDYMKFCYNDAIQVQASGGLTYFWDYFSIPYVPGTFVDPQNISSPRVKPPIGYHVYEVNIKRACYTGADQDTQIYVSAFGYPEIKAVFDTAQIGPDCCSPYEMKYFNNSIGANKHEWTFERVEDTLKSIVLNPEIIYLSNETYTKKDVKTSLKVSFTGNCPDTTSKLIPIKPQITAKGTKGPKSGCQQDVTKTYNVDTVGAGPITSVYWNFGDGDELETEVSNLGPFYNAITKKFDFTHTFTNLTNFDTSYYVTLVFIDSINNCRDTLNAPFMDTVFVPGVARARYSLSTRNGCSPLPVTISNNSNGDVTYKWWFNDTHIFTDPTVTRTDNFATAALSFVNNTSTLPKEYYTYLEVTKTNDDGTTCFDTFGPDTITVNPEFVTTINPAAAQAGCNPLLVDYSQTTTPNVPNLQYIWDFGDGSTSGSDNPPLKTFSHTLPTDQNYIVTLTTTSEYNCKSVATPRNVTVYAYVDAHFTVDDTVGCSPLSANIQNNTAANSFKDFTWTIPAGNIGQPADNVNPFTVRYENKTTANITKTIILDNVNLQGCPKSYSKTLTIFPEVSSLFAQSADTICDNGSITFTNQSFYTGVPATKVTSATPTATFLWNFGDGTTSSSENPAAKVFKNTTGSTVTAPQRFYVRLEITVNGCVNTYTDSIYVKPPVVAQMNTASYLLCSPTAIQIVNTSKGASRYTWEFSDGTATQITNSLNPPLNYAITNPSLNDTVNKMVFLTAANGNCTNKTSITLQVYPELIADIVAPITAGCGPLDVNLTNATLGGNTPTSPLTYEWDFGDGLSSTSSSNVVLHTFGNRNNSDFTYKVRLTAKNNLGCTHKDSVFITVYPELEPLFTYKKSTECSPMNVSMDNSSLNGNQFIWDFGFDGRDTITNNSDFLYNFYHTNANPNVPDTFNIKLVVNDTFHPQCKDSISLPITIFPPVVSNFVVSAGNTVCFPEITQFTNNSTGYQLTYLWDYKDGNTSGTSSNVHTHLFENRGDKDIKYPVKLTAIDINGCPSIDTNNVVVHPRVIAGFTFQKDGLDKCTPIPVSFTYPSAALNGNRFTWNFGDGTPQEVKTNKTGFQHIFDNANPNLAVNYTITLSADDTNTGCSHDTTRTIRIFPRLVPQMKPATREGCNPLTVKFSNQTTPTLSSYSWNFGDNQSSIEKEPRHVFTNLSLQNQDYKVILTATQDSTGCILTADTTITVYSYVDAIFGLVAAGQTGKNSKSESKTIVGGCTPFDVEVTDSSKVNGTKLWDFGYTFTGIADSLAAKHELTYLNIDTVAPLDDATYTIRLVVTNNEGCQDSYDQNLVVYPRPVADFTGDLDGCHPLTIDIDNQSQANNGYTYYWELGDGSTLVTEDIRHTFYNYDYFTTKKVGVKLTASSDKECSATYLDTVTVYPTPLASITPDVDRGCPPFNTVLTNTSKGTGLTYYWDYANGDTDTTQNSTTQTPQYFNNTGQIVTYNVQLITETSTPDQCYDTVLQPIVVYPNVVAAFGPDVHEGCSPLIVNFMNNSNPDTPDGATIFNWSFGDGVNSQTKSPVYRYANETGNDFTYTITLHAASIHGCDSTITDTVAVYLSPNADFVILNPIKTYPDTTYEFNHFVKQGPWTFNWDYGDGSTSVVSASEHLYSYTGWGPKSNGFVDTVWMTVFSNHCSDTAYNLVTRYAPPPVINIPTINALGCRPWTVNFSTSYEYGDEPTIIWDFGDDSPAVFDDPAPSHEYDTAGIFIAYVQIEGDGGIDIDTTRITVHPLPIANFEIAPDFVMLPDQKVQFYNTSYDAISYFWDFGDGGSDTVTSPSYQYKVENLDGYPVTLIATSKYGCLDTLTHHTKVTVSGEGQITFPNAFLPTETKMDGSYIQTTSTDVFFPINYGVRNYELWIFNRWGEQMFYSNNVEVGWNGRYGNDGEMLEQDVYFWKAKGDFYNGVPFDMAGDVTLLRQ